MPIRPMTSRPHLHAKLISVLRDGWLPQTPRPKLQSESLEPSEIYSPLKRNRQVHSRSLAPFFRIGVAKTGPSVLAVNIVFVLEHVH